MRRHQFAKDMHRMSYMFGSRPSREYLIQFWRLAVPLSDNAYAHLVNIILKREDSFPTLGRLYDLVKYVKTLERVHNGTYISKERASELRERRQMAKEYQRLEHSERKKIGAGARTMAEIMTKVALMIAERAEANE